MSLPFVAGTALGAGGYAALRKPRTKEQLQRKKMEGDVLFVVQPKTFLQRAATNLVKSLFF